MGQTLSEPSQEKKTTFGSNDRLAFAVSEMQGWRISMEDAHAIELEIDESEHNSFFAVYDGHGGGTIARYAGKNVHKRLASDDAYIAKDYLTAFKRTFLGTDDDLRADPTYFHDPSGCTAVAALVTADKIICANAGDSRAVLSIRGEAKPLSYDHKPQNWSETSRINSAGGYVEFNRVNGNLALSRAIGDFEFKQNFALPPERQIVTSDPDIIVHDISSDDEFFVMACDGIWDCMSSQDTMSWVRHQITERKSLQQICEDCMTRCLSPDSDVAGGVGCDNMTILIVALLHGRTLDQWYDWIIDRVEKKVGYDTPRSFGPLYSASRYAHAAAVRSGLGEDSPGHTPLLRPSGLWNRFNSPLHLGNSFTGGGLGAGNDVEPDDEEDFEDSGDELMDESPEESLHAILRNAGLNGVISGPVRLHAPPQRDQTSSLRAQLHELDEDRGGQEGDGALVEDDLSQASSDDQSPVLNIASNTITNRQPTSIGSPLIAAPPSLKDMRSPITPNNEQGGPQSPRKSSLPPGANPGNQS